MAHLTLSRIDGPPRCEACRLHMALCLCAEIQTVQTRHRLLVVPHENEAKKTTTTGVLAARVLSNSAVKVVSGKGGVGIIDGGDVDVAHALLLFPAPEAESIIDVVAAFRAHGDPPLTLVVPDGTWSETQKMRRRVPGLAALRPVSLPPGPPTIYRLRHEPKSGGLATLEAIARAFTVLEGGDDDAAKAHVAAVDAALMSTFKRFVERTLWMRGAIGDHELEYGLPAAAKRHSPRGGLPPTS